MDVGREASKINLGRRKSGARHDMFRKAQGPGDQTRINAVLRAFRDVSV
jgi:uncharacterized protein (DUF4415 family)